MKSGNENKRKIETDMASNEPGGYLYGNREPGARRKKLAGYLKAANELRQSYTAQWGQRGTTGGYEDDDQGIPGAFPDVEIVRNGDEEMVLFPSYARRHVKKEKKPVHDGGGSSRNSMYMSGLGDNGSRPSSAQDMEYWKREWEKYEDDTAIVDVDVRGWIYAPHRGPMNRKNRLAIGIARRLAGIPAPSNATPPESRSSSRHSTHREKLEDKVARHEEELVANQAESILHRGEEEADVAWRGGYSQNQNYDSRTNSRSSTPDSLDDPIPGQIPRPITQSSITSAKSNGSRTNLSGAGQSQEDLTVANERLLGRIKPFLSNPLISTPITIFFFNDTKSQSRTIQTNEAGHFSLRAALDFVPTQVRVLASENLSATEDVRITEPKGVSLVSDIDDTIKHSGIGNGAKEIFRNVFIRELGELVVPGVKEWYNKMADMGVEMHYVSNSPWQLYPLLSSYFNLAGLPNGSFHLKQYSGMLQGIFEPAAERKKGTLEKLMKDFPDRKFILVGDSGEADLEVYTDVVVANPGRVLGVFIRDVTTQEHKQKYFDKSLGPVGASDKAATIKDNGQLDLASTRPALPPRRATNATTSTAGKDTPPGPMMGKLIDFSDDEGSSDPPPQATSTAWKAASTTNLHTLSEDTSRSSKSGPPPKPNKPAVLRSFSSDDGTKQLNSRAQEKVASERGSDTSSPKPQSGEGRGPPPPPKPRRLSSAQSSSPQSSQPPRRTLPERTATQPVQSNSNTSEHYYTGGIRERVSAAYNSLPPWSGEAPTQNGQQQSEQSNRFYAQNKKQTPPAPPPPRRSAQSAINTPTLNNRLSWGKSKEIQSYKFKPPPDQSSSNNDSFFTSSSNSSNNNNNNNDDQSSYLSPFFPASDAPNKKEEAWRRRWQRAKDILDNDGVVLRHWRVGTDVEDRAVRLVGKACRDMGIEIGQHRAEEGDRERKGNR